MKKQLLLLAGILLLLLNHLFAQSDNPYVQKVDSMTANLNKSFITTGILYDRAPPLSNLDLFNAQIDTSDYEFFSQAYFELFYAAYNTSGWQTPGQSDSHI